ncbi:GNAT family N-acetyltransferase [Altererythrobacter sp. MF3-039]|uniref:GNAT family N-acetyltransferase n=1 Tax=Altererythrobacter sp. MF3-039 TaxID=3252901 RepID=UPI00390C78BE
MFHRSENLFMRPAWIEDAKAVTQGIGEEVIVRNLARAPWPYTMDNAVEFLSRLDDGSKLPRFALTLPGEVDGPLVGMCGLHEDEDRVELGYWIARQWWGRGIATEAAKAVLEVARAMGFARIHAGHFVDNPASGRVLEKAGFRFTGEMRPQFSLARGETVMSRRYAIDLADGPEEFSPYEMKRAA